MSEEDNKVLQVKGLHRYLGEGEQRTHVLKGLDLTLERGKTYAIAGPSGCGKSTLLYLLGLLDRPDAGEIHLNGRRVDNSDEKQRTAIRGFEIGFVFQFHFLLAEFSALQNLTIPMLKYGKLSPEEAARKAQSLLSAVGLGGKVERMGNQLSGGERQRVAVARALANDPALILADEPTGNLDSANSNSLFENMKQLAHEMNRTILIVTHNKELAASCDYCFEMEDGVFVKGA